MGDLDVVIDGPQPLPGTHATVGECPLYDPANGCLYWVDIPAGRLWRRHDSGAISYRDVGEPLGCVALCVDPSALLLGTRTGVMALDGWDRPLRLLHSIDPERPTQCNDGRCDSDGGFVVGTADPERASDGGLYRACPDGSVVQLLDGIGMSNGLDWSPDRDFFFHVDSVAGTVTRYRWHGDAGRLTDPMVLVEIPPSDGLPDGLTIDAEGCLWLAVWGDGSLRRYDPSGTLLGTITLPVPLVTSCSFGGADGRDLYVTSASSGSGDTRHPGALGGAVHVLRTTIAGQPPSRFENRGARSRSSRRRLRD